MKTKVVVTGVDSGMSAILTVTVEATPGSTNDVNEREHTLLWKDV